MAFRTFRWSAFLLVPLVGGSLLWLAASPPPKDTNLVTAVKHGDFRVVITTTGELQAPQSINIPGPSSSDYATKILTMVPEGTIVKKGDFVAELDRAPIAPRLREASVAIEKAEEQLTQAKLDTTLSIAGLRDQIRDLELALEEKKLAKEQAVYEAPSIKRQAQLDLDKAERELTKLKATYGTKQRQAEAKVNEAAAEVGRQRTKLADLEQLMAEFTVRAPADGMVTYRRRSNGQPRGIGSSVNPYDPIVATLPNLHGMESVTYVNEIDIAKVAVGQFVRIGIDGDASKRLIGKVFSVANMGVQREGSDAKVFQVTILIEGTDTALRPNMTTSNAIETAVIHKALYIPIDAVMSEGDVAYVYKRNGRHIVRQQIETGIASENEIIVRRGLEPADQVLLTEPLNGNTLPLARLH